MKVIKIREGIFQLDFSSQRELASTLLRFQEHYESPKFRGKIFTLGEYRDWYSRDTGGFTYYTDWYGCNFPSYILDNFRKGLFDPLSEAEEHVLEILPSSLDSYYIIGTIDGGGDDVLPHEICHGFYHNNPEYKLEVDILLKSFKKGLKEVYSFIKELGYHEDVLDDEVHAYVAANHSYLDEKGIVYPIKLKEELFRVRKKYKI